MFLRHLELPMAGEAFPFDVPFLRGTREIAFDAPDAFLRHL